MAPHSTAMPRCDEAEFAQRLQRRASKRRRCGLDREPAVVRLLHPNRPMFKIVKCPETSKLELVECVDTPLGHLIHRCTQFRPSCAMTCTRTCATSLDRSAHAEGKPIVDVAGQLVLDFDLDAEAEAEPVS